MPNKPSPQYIPLSVAGKILHLSADHVRRQCVDGKFETAFKPGGGPLSHWLVDRNEVVGRMPNNGNVSNISQ